MVNIKKYLKSYAEILPAGFGVFLNRLPFEVRLGKDYEYYSQLIETCLALNESSKSDYILKGTLNIVKHHCIHTKFYSNFSTEYNNPVSDINFIDIKLISLLTKDILKEILIDERSNSEFSLIKYNTGGTTGNPLSFYVDKKYYAREWAHMHYMWKKIGYHPSNTKITIRGKNIDTLYKYNFNQNEFLINSYTSFGEGEYCKLLKVFRRYNTQFIHGYPSAIYNFLKNIEQDAPLLLDFLKKNIKGIMFGSEYPSPHYRDYIENVLTDNTISWYGHTEGVILAGELYNKYEYVPFLSYGYAEAVKIDGFYHLVGTSFDNLAAPFIRYDTEDLIEPFFSETGILEKFKIKEGRIGEFIKDKNGNNISLTAFIFGRHHKLFDYINFIQVKQVNDGEAIIYYSANKDLIDPYLLFDSTQVNLVISFEQIQEPFKTPLGKIPLLIK